MITAAREFPDGKHKYNISFIKMAYLRHVLADPVQSIVPNFAASIKKEMTVCIKSLIKNLNIVVGCTIGCSYCYARTNCRRFHITEDFSVPEYMDRKLRLIDNPRPHVWLMTGMSDFSDWKPLWKEEIADRMAANPQHAYIFLTKRPEKADWVSDDDNVWMGVTVTCEADRHRIDDLRRHIRARHYHVTFEPLFSAIPDIDFTGIEWVVIGTETGRRKGKVDAKPEWVLDIASQAKARGIPVFMKEDLLPIMGEERMIQELPEGFKDKA